MCGDRAREGVMDENFPNPGQVGCKRDIQLPDWRE